MSNYQKRTLYIGILLVGWRIGCALGSGTWTRFGYAEDDSDFGHLATQHMLILTLILW